MNVENKRRVLIERIVTDPEFRVRHEIDPEHVEKLIRAIRLGSEMPPMLVWRDPAGRMVLLDGEHRLRAFQWIARGKDEPMSAAVRFFSGDRTGALMAALMANVRDKLPMTKAEKEDFAWKIVRDEGALATVKKAPLARATGLHRHTIDKMMKRTEEMRANDVEPCGQWRLDRGLNKTSGKDDLDAREMAEAIAEMTGKLIEAIGFIPNRFSPQRAEIISGAVQRALPKRIRDLLAEEILGDRLQRTLDCLREEMETEREPEEDTDDDIPFD